MKNNFLYQIGLEWQGAVNIEKNYRYNKTYELSFENKPKLVGSADATFHGDPELYNPEELLMAALASCHMMSFFYLCGKEKIVIEGYKDQPRGILKVNANGSGQFDEVTLQPRIKVKSDVETNVINKLFSQANDYCFIARSCNFRIVHEPSIEYYN